MKKTCSPFLFAWTIALPAVFFAHAAPAAREPHFHNVVPVFAGHEDFAVSEILRQRTEVGLGSFLLSLSFHPQCTPARDLIPELCGRFRKVRAGVAGSGVELGVLVQSLLGHGWNGKVALSEEPWQHVELVDGSVSPRYCSMDPGFRMYVREAIASIAKEGPTLMLIDDDVGIRLRECYCPLHMKAISRRLGRDVSREDLARMYAERLPDDPELLAAAEVLGDTIVAFAKTIREAIDSVDPSIRSGICACWAGQWQMDAVVRTLAGGNRPLMRVNDAIYGNQRPAMIVEDFVLASRVREHVGPDVEVLDETDTFPHNYMSESATVFHSHITTAMLSGLDGCKLWTSEFRQPVHTGSQRKYERRLKDWSGFYRTLYGLSDQMSWKGISLLKFRQRPGLGGHPERSADGLLGSWHACGGRPEVVYSLPVCCERPGSPQIASLCADDIGAMTYEDLERVLSGRTVLDSSAARLLTERGFASLIGIKATKGGDDFCFSSEELADGSLNSAFMWNETSSLLEPIADGVEPLAWFCKGRRFIDSSRAFPSATFFRNRLGGRIVALGWDFKMPYYDIFRPLRRAQMLKFLDRLGDGPLEMAVENGAQNFVRHGVLPDGTEIVALIPLGLDAEDTLPLRLFRTPVRVERLEKDGAWRAVPFRRISEDILEVSAPIVCAEPLVLRFAFGPG